MDKIREDYWTKKLELAEKAKIFPRMAIAAGMAGFALAALLLVIGLIFNAYIILYAIALAAAAYFSVVVLGSSFEARVDDYNKIYDALQAERNKAEFDS